jgi:hypothetical protein
LQLSVGNRIQPWVLSKDRLLELAEGTARLDAELLDEGAAGVLIARERLGLASRPVESQHQLSSQALAQGVFGDERLERADAGPVASEGELGLELVLECLESNLFEPSDLGLGEAIQGEVSEWWSPP